MGENRTSQTLQHTQRIAIAPSLQRFLDGGTHGADGPTDIPIHAIHRGPTGVIPLAVKEHGREWKPLGALRVGQPLLPELCRALMQNAYFALNTSFGKPKPRFETRTRESWQPIPDVHGSVHPRFWQKDSFKKLPPAAQERIKAQVPRQLVTQTATELVYNHADTGLPLVEHNNDTLRWLNCAYADIDCYKLGLTVGEAFGAIVDMQNAGALPPATLVAQSGRGLWLLWLLVDVKNPTEGEQTIYGQTHAPGTPQRASSRAVRLYARVQRALVDKLEHLGADMGAVDGPRYAPMPGTQKTTGNARVLYWAQHLGDGLPVYTLHSLCDALGLETTRHEHAVIAAAFPDSNKNPQNVTKGKRGHRQRWLYVVADLETLFELRDGYGAAASRHVAALFHAAALHRAGMAPADAESRVTRYWKRSRTKGQDVLSDTELPAVFRQARKRQTTFTRMRRETYLTSLHVTPEERSYLDATTQRPQPQTAPTTVTERDTRRAAIVGAIHQTFGGHVPSCRDMADHLTSQGVPCGNHTTVWRDYRAMGLEPLTRAGRPPKLPL